MQVPSKASGLQEVLDLHARTLLNSFVLLWRSSASLSLEVQKKKKEQRMNGLLMILIVLYVMSKVADWMVGVGDD